MIIKYDKHKSKAENNEKILTAIADCDFSLLNKSDLTILGDSLFKLFKDNFESSNYSIMEMISKYCKVFVDSCIDRKLYTACCGDTLIDIACFVFEQMCMYEDKVSCLKAIIHSDNIDKTLRVRALKEILSIEPEIQSLIKNDFEEYSLLLQQLTN